MDLPACSTLALEYIAAFLRTKFVTLEDAMACELAAWLQDVPRPDVENILIIIEYLRYN
jgi:hypothetical protein